MNAEQCSERSEIGDEYLLTHLITLLDGHLSALIRQFFGRFVKILMRFNLRVFLFGFQLRKYLFLNHENRVAVY